MHHFTRTSIAAALLSLGSLNAFADNIQTDELDPVIITATRMPQKTLTTLNDVSVITEEDIARSGVNDLPSLLKRTNGIEISTTGNAGSVTSLFIRGTKTNQTVVLIDGVRIASATTGDAAFNHITLNQIERIEIVRGAASSIYGADAVGGVIQIFTKKPEDGSFNANIGAGVGNQNAYEVDGNISGQIGKLGYQLSASHQQTKGFSAQNEHGFSFNPDKDGYKNTALSGSLSYDIADGHQLIARALNNKDKVQYDAANPKQDYNTTRLHVYSIESKNRLAENLTSSFLLSNSAERLEMTSDNKDAYTGFINSKTNKAQWILNGTSQYINWLAGAEWQKQKVDSSSEYTKNKRTNKAVFAGLDFSKDKFLIESSLRHDNDEDYGNETTGRMALGYRITDNLTARASYGTSFRAPTFNDLYIPFASGYQGNPNLKAEKGKNTEIGLSYDDKTTSIQWSVFQNKINNLINTAYFMDILTSMPVNVDRAKITGTSLIVKHRLNDNITLRGDITYQNPKDEKKNEQLLRRSKVFGNLGIDYDVNEKLTVSANQHLHGKSHDMVYGKGQVRLGGYGLTSVSAQYQINPKWQVSLSGDNIFDKKYTTAYGYNTPGASVMLRSRYQF